MHLGLLLVLHPDTRIGQDLRIGELAQQIEGGGRQGVEGLQAIQALHQIVCHAGDGGIVGVGYGRRPRGQGIGNNRLGTGVAEADPDRIGTQGGTDLQLVVVGYFHQFQIEHHFRIPPVGGFDDLLGQLDDLGGIADDQGIEFFMHVDLAQLQHGAQQIDRFFGVDIRQIEGLDDVVLVLFDLLLGIAVDDDGLAVEHFFAQIVHTQK